MRRRKPGVGSMATTSCPSSFKVSGSPTGLKLPPTRRPLNPEPLPPEPSGHHQNSAIAPLVPASLSAVHSHYYAQIDSLFRCAPADADVLIRMDADTLPVRNFEDLLDYVLETSSVAGVITHYKFPTPPGLSARESWLKLADQLITESLDFSHTCSLSLSDVPEEDRSIPFCVNDGMVLFAKSVFPDVARHYLELRPKLMDRIPDPYFSGQIALALAIAQSGVRTCALPIRYNFPNDELAVARYPEEMDAVTIFHYLRTNVFDRQQIFSSAEAYREFLGLPLVGANKIFQSCVLELIGPEYPFVIASEKKPLPASPHPVSVSLEVTYDAALSEYQAEIAPIVERVDEEIGLAAAQGADQNTMKLLQTKRTLIFSGLFDPDFYLENNTDVKAGGGDPLEHYLRHGDAEGRYPNPFFNPHYYRLQTGGPTRGQNALEHYITQGEQTGLLPSCEFDPHGYLAANPQLRTFVQKPLFHFLKIGRRTGLPCRIGNGWPTALLPGWEHATNVDALGRHDLEKLLLFKRGLRTEYSGRTHF